MRYRKMNDLTKRQLMDMITNERKARHMDELKERTYLRFCHKVIINLLDILHHNPDAVEEMDPDEREEFDLQVQDDTEEAIAFLVSLENHLGKNKAEAN